MCRRKQRAVVAATLALWSAIAAAIFPTYTRVTGAGNPFNGVDLDGPSTPRFVDINNDGDLDFFSGQGNGTIVHFRNNGSATAPSFSQVTGTGNPFNGVNVGGKSSPAFVDIDNDGDADAFIGDGNGTISFYRNTGSASAPVFTRVTGAANPFNSHSVSGPSHPFFVNIDGDGDFDAFLGSGSGKITFFRNTGSATAPVFTQVNGAANNPLHSVNVNGPSVPAFGDLDQDGDFDAAIGNGSGTVDFYENTGSATSVSFTQVSNAISPFGSVSVGGPSVPTFADIDGDGDLDAFLGDGDGTINFFRADPGATSTIGRFNAVEVGANAITGVVQTKIAATNFNLDIVAINAAKTAQDATFRGNVDIFLLDATNDTAAQDQWACRSSWTVIQNLGRLNLRNQDNGRRTLNNINYPNSVRKARLRITDGTLIGCSVDPFAIRPASLQIAASDATATTAGTTRTLNAITATATPFHYAGTPFTVRATAYNSSNNIITTYDGSPTLTATGSVLGTTIGTMTQGTWSYASGVATNNNVTYSEVGAFTLQAQDTTFAAVDAADGSTTTQRYVPAVTASVGRFTPADFTVSYNTPRFSPACSTFTYLGQPFAYSTTPTMTVTAVNASGGTTTNYTGTLFKLLTTSVSGKSYLVNSGTLDTSGLLAPAVTVTSNNNGSASIALDSNTGSRLALMRGAATAAYDAEIRLQGSLADSDGVAFSGNPFAFGNTTTGAGILFGAGGTSKQMRFGRLRMLNAYGSERMPLDVPLRVEYFDSVVGSTGFITSSTDGCTVASAIQTSHIALNESALGNGTAGQTSVLGTTLSGGVGAIRLRAPTNGVTGRVGLTLNLLPTYYWLQTDNNNDGSYVENPSADASFGLYATDPRQVYSREMVR